MIICSNSLFVHIPKTGGTSIRRCLLDSGRLCALLTPVADPTGDLRGQFNQWDPHAHPLVFEQIFRALRPGMFTFTFVRNPWDRFVSWWADSKSHGKEPFSEFLPRLLEDPAQRVLQSGYVTYRSSFDFVGRFERLEKDWDTVKNEAYLRAMPPLQKLRTSIHDPYESYYTPELKDLVYSKERLLINRFNYQFGAHDESTDSSFEDEVPEGSEGEQENLSDLGNQSV